MNGYDDKFENIQEDLNQKIKSEVNGTLEENTEDTEDIVEKIVEFKQKQHELDAAKESIIRPLIKNKILTFGKGSIKKTRTTK